LSTSVYFVELLLPELLPVFTLVVISSCRNNMVYVPANWGSM